MGSNFPVESMSGSRVTVYPNRVHMYLNRVPNLSSSGRVRVRLGLGLFPPFRKLVLDLMHLGLGHKRVVPLGVSP